MHSLQLPAAPNLSIHSHSHLNPCPLFLLCSSMSRGRALSLAAPEQTKGLKDAVQRNKAIKMAGAWAFCAARAAASVCMLTALRRRPCLACLPASRHRPPLQRCYPGPPVHSLAPRRPVAPAADKAQWKLGRAAKKGEADRCGAGQGCLSFRIRTVHAAWLIDSLFGGSPPHCPPKLTLACSAAINLAVVSRRQLTNAHLGPSAAPAGTSPTSSPSTCSLESGRAAPQTGGSRCSGAAPLFATWFFARLLQRSGAGRGYFIGRPSGMILSRWQHAILPPCCLLCCYAAAPRAASDCLP